MRSSVAARVVKRGTMLIDEEREEMRSEARSLRRVLRGLLIQATGSDQGRVSALLPDQDRLVGAVDLGQPLVLREGRYDLVIRVGQKRYQWPAIELRGESRYKAGATP